MPYSTVAAVRLALYPADYDAANPPTTASNTAADLSNAQIQDAIAEADSKIDSYIGGRYQVPVAANTDGSLPHPIDFWSRSIAAYLATIVFRRSADFTDNDPVARRYNATLADLVSVRDGKSTLMIPDTASLANAEGAGAPVNPYVGSLFAPEDFSLGYSGPNAFIPGVWGRW